MPAILVAVVLLGILRPFIADVTALGAEQESARQFTITATPDGPGGAAPQPVSVDTRRLDAIEPLVRAAIEEKKLPGAVVLVGRGDKILYQKAIGNRALVPNAEAMTLDTMFDLASLTKVVATTTSVMILVEQGRIRLSDRVSSYIPGFERYGKGDITVRHLLTHVSGLRPDVDLAEMWTGYETAIALAVDEVPTTKPGERFVYSDINFFLLGDIVRRVSGLSLDRFAREKIFEPLGMKDTAFNPPATLASRIAPTESCTRYGWPCQGPEMMMLRGIVHDPTARRMGGVAGHAGLFSTAADLAIFCRMLLDGGAVGRRSRSVTARRREDDEPCFAGSRDKHARTRLGHRLRVFVESRRAAADRIVWPHWLHRHFPVDRSDDRRLCHLPVEPRAPGWQGRRHAASRAGRDGCCSGGDEPAVGNG